ncbi:MAG: hypothetical protein SH857_04585 [Chitinophagales bacterium]|nr:hypothetical protein [Chitinophagales bacterium]
MKNLFFALVAVLSLFVIGCNSSETATESTTDTNATTVTPVETPTEVAPTADPVQIEVAPPTLGTPSGDAKLNPPHGEPGHRCDIAVGAPLPM